MTSKVEVETVEQLIRKAFQQSKSPNRIALARQAVHAIHLNRAGDIFGVWKRLVLIAKIERDSDDLATWAEVIEAVGAMVFLINRSFHE